MNHRRIPGLQPATALQMNKLFDKSDSLEKLWQPTILADRKTAGLTFHIRIGPVNQYAKPRCYQTGGVRFEYLGISITRMEKFDHAVRVFTLNTQLFPASVNTYDSLAKAYWSLGDSKNAIKFYNKVPALQPDNNNTKNRPPFYDQTGFTARRHRQQLPKP